MAPNSFGPINDVPEAQRDGQSRAKPSTKARGVRRWIVWFLVGLLSAIAGLAVSWLTYGGPELGSAIAWKPMVTVFRPQAVVSSSATGQGTNELATPPLSLDSSVEKTLLGHRAYEEAPESELVELSYNREIQLRATAAAEFEALMVEAEAQGIYPVPLSGFRSVADQQYLFFDLKAERAQSAATRAEVSAPPGYSEHHTGYAIDIGDANFPDTDLEISFEETPTFQWLAQNAPRYSFELSFPEGNPQGIQYEPWHWRYVGDSDSLETFYQAQ